jgi:hypothetical protein
MGPLRSYAVGSSSREIVVVMDMRLIGGREDLVGVNRGRPAVRLAHAGEG